MHKKGRSKTLSFFILESTFFIIGIDGRLIFRPSLTSLFDITYVLTVRPFRKHQPFYHPRKPMMKSLSGIYFLLCFAAINSLICMDPDCSQKRNLTRRSKSPHQKIDSKKRRSRSSSRSGKRQKNSSPARAVSPSTASDTPGISSPSPLLVEQMAIFIKDLPTIEEISKSLGSLKIDKMSGSVAEKTETAKDDEKSCFEPETPDRGEEVTESPTIEELQDFINDLSVEETPGDQTPRGRPRTRTSRKYA